MTEKKAVIVTPFCEPETGACTLRVNFFKSSLEEKGFSVKTVSPKKPMVQELNKNKRFTTDRDFFSFMWKEKPDLVIGVSPPLMIAFKALVASKITGAKFILDAKEDADVYNPRLGNFLLKIKNKLLLLFRRFTYLFSDRLMFLTESDMAEAIQSYGIEKKKLVMVMNGTDTKVMRRDKKEGERMRKELGVKESETLVVYAGSIGTEETGELIDSFKDPIVQEKARLLLLIAFDSTKYGKKEFDVLKEEINKSGLGNKIILRQNIPYAKVYKYLSACEIGILPWPDYLRTSLPVKLFDYCAAGLHILAKGPKGSELDKFFSKNNVGGIDYSWSEFSQNLKKIVGNKKLLEKSSVNNRILAETIFDRRHQKKAFFKTIDI
ncbi:MAG: hypothetical protein ABIH20_03870 [Candidatus Diapherotrites archaeon]